MTPTTDDVPQVPDPEGFDGSYHFEEVQRIVRDAVLADRERRAACAEDAKRLDWLEAEANKLGGLLLHDGSESGRRGLGLRPGYIVRTLREAIDAAIAARERVPAQGEKDHG